MLPFLITFPPDGAFGGSVPHCVQPTDVRTHWLGRPSEAEGAPEVAAQRFAEGGCNALDGAWAFVRSDPATGGLCAAVDALGRRALYWARTSGRLLLSNDIATLLDAPGVSSDLDEQALADHLVGYPWNEERTPYAAIRRLAAGHRLDATVAGDAQGAAGSAKPLDSPRSSDNALTMTVTRWWNPSPERIGSLLRGSTTVLAARWRDELQRAVAEHLPQGVDDVGVLLSGGLDSTGVAAMARASAPNVGLHAASHTFETLRTCDESGWIRLVASELNMATLELDTERHPLLSDLDGLPRDRGEPFLAWSSADHALFAQLRTQGVRHVLTGHGGDLLAGGTTLALASRLGRGRVGAIADAWRDTERRRSATSWGRWTWDQGLAPWIPAHRKAQLRDRWRADHPGRRATPPPWIAREFAQRTGLYEGRPARPPAPKRHRDPARQALYATLLHPGAISRAARWLDRVSATSGVIVEHPFLDRRLAELALRMPPDQFYRAGRRKGLHRKAFRGLLPDAVLDRATKTDLSPFHDASLRTPEAVSLVRGLLRDPISAQRHIVDPALLRVLHENVIAGEGGPAADALWAWLTLERWLRESE